MSVDYWIQVLKEQKQNVTPQDKKRLRILWHLTGGQGLLPPLKLHWQVLQDILNSDLYNTLHKFSLFGDFPLTITLLGKDQIPIVKICLRIPDIKLGTFWELADFLLSVADLPVDLEAFPITQTICLCVKPKTLDNDEISKV